MDGGGGGWIDGGGGGWIGGGGGGGAVDAVGGMMGSKISYMEVSALMEVESHYQSLFLDLVCILEVK